MGAGGNEYRNQTMISYRRYKKKYINYSKTLCKKEGRTGNSKGFLIFVYKYLLKPFAILWQNISAAQKVN